MYEYRARITRVVDGDTVDAEIDLGFGCFQCERLRLAGLNAPETRGGERVRGLDAKHFLETLIEKHPRLTIRTEKDRQGKYGRYIATLYGDDIHGAAVNLNLALIHAGHAVPAQY